MSDPYVGEIRIFAGSFAPVGWMLCQGQLLPITDDYYLLFNLIGTTYGGDGETTFALPNLSSRVPVHGGQSNGGSSYITGQMSGVESVTLTSQQLPVHSHPAVASAGPATTTAPGGAVWADWGGGAYSTDTDTVAMNAAALAPTGGNQPHDNMPPFLAVNFIIAINGKYPSQA